MLVPALPEQRRIIVAAHGGALQKSSLDTAWQRLVKQAIDKGIMTGDQRFGLHDFKRRGITDTLGNRADKQEASGHRDASMLNVYDLSVPIVDPAGID
jgi:integrase